jgi:hypothetical protein
MARDSKLIAAISTAVYAYLEAERQEQRAEQVRPAIFRAASPWSLAGRQAVMERRFQMQFRTLR